MDIYKELREKYPNFICEKCNLMLKVCLDVPCSGNRIFCYDCDLGISDPQTFNYVKEGETIINQCNGLHKNHMQNVFSASELAEVNGEMKIYLESISTQQSPMSIKQNETYECLMREIDEFECKINQELKNLRMNVSEKYNLINESFTQNVVIEAHQIQEILKKYRKEYGLLIETKIQDLLKNKIYPVKLNFEIRRDSWNFIQQETLKILKTLQNTITLTHKVEIKQLINPHLDSSILDMSSFRDCFAFAGNALSLFSPQSDVNYFNKIYELDLKQAFRSVAFSRDGKFLAAVGSGNCLLYCTEKMKIIFSQNSNQSLQYHAVDISPDNQYMALSGKQKKTCNNIFIFDISSLDNQYHFQTLDDHSSLVLSLKFSDDNRFLISSGCDYKIIVFAKSPQSQKFEKVQILTENEDIINGIALSNDSKTLVSVASDGRCIIYTRNNIELQAIQSGIATEEEENKIQIDNIFDVNNVIQLQKSIERLNNIRIEMSESDMIKEKKYQQEELQNQKQILFRRNMHSNPFLVQSLIQDNNLTRHQMEATKKNQGEGEQSLSISASLNFIQENFIDQFQQAAFFILAQRQSINCVDIDKSSNYLTIACGADILIYSISDKSHPQLLTCVKNSIYSVINKVKFSHSESTVYFCDQLGQFQSFKYQ